MAEEFNEYFSSVFSLEDMTSLPEEGGGRAGEDLSDMVVSREKVRGLLGKLRADKVPGVDELSSRLMLHFPDEILAPVCMLFEKSLREGKVPEDWRRANVVPIYKAGDRGEAKNYRPVSLTCQLCKVFERLVRDELVEHLESKGLLGETQHGFRMGKSCLTNLLTFLDRVTEELDDGGSVDVIYLDFAKAFDKVPHHRSDLIELFKISRGLSAIPWNLFFRANNSERTRGHSRKLVKESFRLDIRKYFFSQRVLSRWNRLSEDGVTAGSVVAFKRRLEEFRKKKMDFLKDSVR